MKNILLSIFILTTWVVSSQTNRFIRMTAEMLKIMTLDDGTDVEYWGYSLIRDNGAYNASLPGPFLEFNKGDTVTIRFINNSPEDHTIHLHGLDVDQANDGVPSTSFAINPYDSVDYEFVANHAGTFLYHCHVLTTLHLTMGMYGMIVVNNYPDSLRLFDGGPKFTKQYSFITSDMDKDWNLNPLSINPMFSFRANYFMVNGLSGNQLYTSNSDHIESYYSNTDTTVLRLSNIGYSKVRYIFPEELNAKAYMSDGRVLTQSFDCDTLEIHPGERYSIVLIPEMDIDTDIFVEYYEARNGELQHTNRIRLNRNLGLDEDDLSAENVLIYPNPTKGLFYFRTPDTGKELYVFDLSGKKVYGEKIHQYSTPINLDDLKKGMYILKYNGKSFKLVIH